MVKTVRTGRRSPSAALRDAHQLIRITRRRFAGISGEEGWSGPVSPVGYLILEQLGAATVFGLTPRRLGHLLDLPPSTLAYHLDRLEEANLVERRARGFHDGRQVSVRATKEGTYAARRLESALRNWIDRKR